MRIHKFLMALLASLQLEIFVLIAGMGLWINILTDTAISLISAHTPIYKALYISTVILLLPWIAMGWYAIRHELRRTMILFLAIGFVITAGWAILFYSLVFRWSFMQWPYLGCFTVASFVLLIASIILGVVCRVHFGKGLKQYLHAEETLASINFAPDEFAHRPESSSSATTPKSASSTRKDSCFGGSPPSEYFVMQEKEEQYRYHYQRRQSHVVVLPSSTSPPPYPVPF